MAFRKEESEKIPEQEIRIVEIVSRNRQRAQILQPQQMATSQIESQFLSYQMQTPAWSLPTTTKFNIWFNTLEICKVKLSFRINIQMMKKNVWDIVEFTLKQN